MFSTRFSARRHLRLPGLMVGLALLVGSQAAAAATLTTLYSFGGGTDGGAPASRLVLDAQGNLFGTTAGTRGSEGTVDATVFELSPPQGQATAWTETVLTVFRAAAWITGGVTFNSKGRLFFTASGGIFKLIPSAQSGAPWTRVTIFVPPPRSAPPEGVQFDGDGRLFGATLTGGPSICSEVLSIVGSCGTVYRLSPLGQAGWVRNRIYAFQGHANDGYGPNSELLFDPANNIFGTTVWGGPTMCFVDVFTQYACGTVFELVRPTAAVPQWTEKVLYKFNPTCGEDCGPDGAHPNGGVVRDPEGNIYGTTNFGGSAGDGIVFELTPPAVGDGAWTETIIHSFASSECMGPEAGLAIDAAGNLYGTTGGGGTSRSGCVFELSPPAGGAGTWTETVLYSFANGDDGCAPLGALTLDASGNIYCTTSRGGASGNGTVFELSP